MNTGAAIWIAIISVFFLGVIPITLKILLNPGHERREITAARIIEGGSSPARTSVMAPEVSAPAWEAVSRSPVKLPKPARSKGSGIFISYRRQDEPNFAGRLYDRVVARFGKSNVFMDVDTIELGLDFTEVIDKSLSQCRVMIVVIGKQWLHITDEDGEQRLHNPDDYVRLEIEKALDSNKWVIPVLVEGAAVPKSSQLPKPLAPLARRNGIAMAHASFGSDAERLIARLDGIMKARQNQFP